MCHAKSIEQISELRIVDGASTLQSMCKQIVQNQLVVVTPMIGISIFNIPEKKAKAANLRKGLEETQG